MAKKKKKIEQICKNCQLYNPTENVCGIMILHEGEKMHLPVDAADPCFFENTFVAKDGEAFVPAEDIRQIKAWMEDPETGEKTSGDGIVKIEYPQELDAEFPLEGD